MGGKGNDLLSPFALSIKCNNNPCHHAKGGGILERKGQSVDRNTLEL